MDAFFDALAQVLAFFYDLVPNYGVAIILLTLVVMIIVTPLTLKGTRSMMMMQQLQPEMRKIQQKYKDDRQKLNEELLKFYKENNINPLGGCLPLLVQMPIFIVLYQVLRGLTRRTSDFGFDTGWVTGQVGAGQAVTDPETPIRTFDPAYVPTDTRLYQDLQGATQMSAFGIDLAESASQAMGQGFLHALPFFILIAIVAATGFIQQKQISGRNTNAQINPQQQMLMKIMPVFLPVISFGLPAGLVLYFAISNLYRIGQQAFISRSIYGMKGKNGKASAGGAKAKGDDGKGTTGKDKEAKDAGKKAKATNGKDDQAKGPGASSKPAKAQGTKGRGASKGGGRGAGRSGKSSGSGARGQRTSRTSGRGARGSNGQSEAPALQPRARKNKKR
jgi:YidC/Oxa1 family membrane protein insertase